MTSTIIESVLGCTPLIAIVVMFITARLTGFDVLESITKIIKGDFNALFLIFIYYGFAYILTVMMLQTIS